jgi:hypothetical protein
MRQLLRSRRRARNERVNKKFATSRFRATRIAWTPRERKSATGKPIRYFPVSLRAGGKLIALDDYYWSESKHRRGARTIEDSIGSQRLHGGQRRISENCGFRPSSIFVKIMIVRIGTCLLHFARLTRFRKPHPNSGCKVLDLTIPFGWLAESMTISGLFTFSLHPQVRTRHEREHLFVGALCHLKMHDWSRSVHSSPCQ